MTNNYPQGTNELYKQILGNQNTPQPEAEAVGILPGGQDIETKADAEQVEDILKHDKETNTYTVDVSRLSALQIFKNIFPFIVVFLIALLAYFLLFTNISLKSFFESEPKRVISEQSIPKDKLDAYNAWITSYYFDVSDPKILDPNYDISGNGLTNYQKFLLGLNPKRTDTIGLGLTDTQALLAGINPLTGKSLTDSEKDYILANIDLEALSNRLTLNAARNVPKVAGANTGEGRSSVLINTDVYGELEIPSLKIKAPVIWSKEPKDFNTDLQNGVVHYPGTAMPGEIGTAYISGHSSNYAWAKGEYNRIFEKLADLKQYDSFSITVTDKDNKKVTLHYIVVSKNTFKADDQNQFAHSNKSVVALSTCWPVGTTANRMVVFGELSQITR